MDIKHENEISDDEDSDEEIDLGIVRKTEDGKEVVEKFLYNPSNRNNQKKLICYSVINRSICKFEGKCTYAHSLKEQEIGYARKFIYQIILDEKMMDFFSLSNPKTVDLYVDLMSCVRLCEKCSRGKCTGGYNCIKGVCSPSLLVCCKNLIGGSCHNKLTQLNIDKEVLNKIDNIVSPETYMGCPNGHHLTTRGLMPFKKYCAVKEASKTENIITNNSNSVYLHQNQMSSKENVIYKTIYPYHDTAYAEEEEFIEDDEISDIIQQSPSIGGLDYF